MNKMRVLGIPFSIKKKSNKNVTKNIQSLQNFESLTS